MNLRSLPPINTGTIENHLGEFWTLCFINPGLLGSRQRFNERFAIPIERTTSQPEMLKKLIQLLHPKASSTGPGELPPAPSAAGGGVRKKRLYEA
jgi:SNF2 family DNA or RNA helicase